MTSTTKFTPAQTIALEALTDQPYVRPTNSRRGITRATLESLEARGLARRTQDEDGFTIFVATDSGVIA